VIKRLLLCLAVIVVTVGSAPLTANIGEAEPVRVELVTEESAILSSRPFWVGVRMKMEDGWHTYWKNPGDSGMATSIEWHLPEGFSIGELQWPRPTRFEHQSLVGFGYENEVLLMAEVTPPATLRPGDEIPISAEVSWIACADSCVPGFVELKKNFKVATTPTASHWSNLFRTFKARLPQKALRAELARDGERLQLRLELPDQLAQGVQKAYFFPDAEGTIDHTVPQEMHFDAQKLSLSLQGVGSEKLSSMTGLLVLEHGGGPTSFSIEALIDGADGISGAEGSAMSFGLALLFAFLGGLILNLMPCVLPVISLKVMGFVEMADKGRREGMRHGLAFTSGVLLSFMVLAGLLLILRATGEGLGWGFQLQNPMFVAILAGVIFLLGLSLFGVYELGTSMISLGNQAPKSKGIWSSFMTGILATAVATPCTGPMLGPALGYAVTIPAFQSLIVFAAIALGLSAPYLILAIKPEWLRFLPKPGKWMITFKQLMGFLMMATLIWLLWVFSAEVGSTVYLVGLIATLFLMSMGAWIYGKWGAPHNKRLTRRIMQCTSIAIVLFAFVTGVGIAKWGGEAGDLAVVTESQGGWRHWSPESMHELQAAGTPVFVDFTAKWCLTCQANKPALRSSQVTEFFKERGIVSMQADWTKRDPRITEELAKLGRSGVPVYAYYPAGLSSKPIILPQVLTSGTIIGAVEPN
jgi:thiol:disulfide interchange protein